MQNIADVIGRTVGMVGGRIRWFAGWNFRIQFLKQNYHIRWPACPIRPRTTMEPFDAKGFYSKYQRRGSDKLISQSDHQQIKNRSDDQTINLSSDRLIGRSSDGLISIWSSDLLIVWSGYFNLNVWCVGSRLVVWSAGYFLIVWSSDVQRLLPRFMSNRWFSTFNWINVSCLTTN